MGHRVGLHGDVADPEWRLVAVDQLQRGKVATAALPEGAVGYPHRQPVTPGQRPDPLDVVLVFVGHQDRRQAVRCNPEQIETPLYLPGGKTAIQQ